MRRIVFLILATSSCLPTAAAAENCSCEAAEPKYRYVASNRELEEFLELYHWVFASCKESDLEPGIIEISVDFAVENAAALNSLDTSMAEELIYSPFKGWEPLETFEKFLDENGCTEFYGS